MMSAPLSDGRSESLWLGERGRGGARRLEKSPRVGEGFDWLRFAVKSLDRLVELDGGLVTDEACPNSST